MSYFYKGCEIQTPFTVEDVKRTFENTSFSLRVSRMVMPAQKWALTFSVASNDETDLLSAHTINFFGEDSMIMPQPLTPKNRSTFNGTAICGAANAGSSSVVITPTGSGRIAKGSFISFELQKKVYMVTEDCDLTDNNAAILKIYPDLTGDVMANETLNTNDNVIFYYLRDDSMIKGAQFSNGGLVSAQINLMENV